jgi:hypothetical protein
MDLMSPKTGANSGSGVSRSCDRLQPLAYSSTMTSPTPGEQRPAASIRRSRDSGSTSPQWSAESCGRAASGAPMRRKHRTGRHRHSGRAPGCGEANSQSTGDADVDYRESRGCAGAGEGGIS